MDTANVARYLHERSWRSKFTQPQLSQPIRAVVDVRNVRKFRNADQICGHYFDERGNSYAPTLSAYYYLDSSEIEYVQFDCDCGLNRPCIHIRGLCEHIERQHLHSSGDAEIKYFAQAMKGLASAMTPTPSSQTHRLAALVSLHSSGVGIGSIGLVPILLSPNEDPRSAMRVTRHSQVSECCSREDEMLFSLLCPVETDAQESRVAVLSTTGQERAFETLLESGRLFLSHPRKGSWSVGEDVTPSARWIMGGAGNQRLTLCSPDQVPIKDVRKIQSTWYVDSAAARLGKLLIPPETAMAIVESPTLVSSRSDVVRERWLKLAQPNLPPPIGISQVKDVTVRPKARLKTRLSPAVNEGAPREDACVASVSYDYDGIEVMPEQFGLESTIVVDTPKGPRRIHRNVDLEIATSRRLVEMGLANTGRNSGEFKVQTKDSQETARFVNAMALLKADGYSLDHDDGSLGIVDVDNQDALKAELSPTNESSWFDLALGVELDGKKQDLAPLIVPLLQDRNFSLSAADNEPADLKWALQLEDGKIIRLPVVKLRQFLGPIAEWVTQDASDGRSKGSLRLSRLQAAAVAEEMGTRSHLLPDLRTAIHRLRHLDEIPEPSEPAGFVGELRSYQRVGLRWLNASAEGRLGGLLADDMGLGKTVQIIAHLLAQKELGRLDDPVLVVVPTSLVGNWQDECAKFAPGLKLLVLHGPDRGARFQRIKEHDLVITTYPLLTRDAQDLAKSRFSIAIFDEANAIKNADGRTARCARMLQVERVIAMTGTPVENNLGELWAQIDLALPTMLGDRRHFTRAYRTPVEKHGKDERLQTLKARLKPFILRRTKAEVMGELPPKTEIVQHVELEGDQRTLYESLRVAMHERVQTAIREKGMAKSGIIILDALLKLRQACCDPRLVKLKAARAVAESAKREALMGLIGPLIEEGRKILVFSQFTSMLDLISEQLDEVKVPHAVLSGQTADRMDVVRRFQAGEVPVFLISLKAGGVGLNLTAADTVIHYDPWWNPAIENQATDRAHRMGQDKPVFVYKLICAGTVEEKIAQLQARKAELANALLDGGATKGLSLTEEEVDLLFGPE